MAKAKQTRHLVSIKATPSDIKEAEISLRYAESLRQKCRTVGTRHKVLSMELCEAVSETECAVIKRDGEYVYCWALWGYTSWEEFLGKEMDLHLATAYALRNVWQTFGIDLKGSWDADLLLGITKMKLLTLAPLNRKNVNSWLRKAKAMTCKSLRAEVYGEEETHKLNVPLTGSQLRQVQSALEMAKSAVSNGERMNRGELLTQIISEWSASRRGATRRAA